MRLWTNMVLACNLFYNKDAGVRFCLLDAPDTEAAIKHHDKVNIECEWITQVTMAKVNKIMSNMEDKNKQQP